MDINNVKYTGLSLYIKSLIQGQQMARDLYLYTEKSVREERGIPSTDELYDNWPKHHRDNFNIAYFFDCERLEPMVLRYLQQFPGSRLGKDDRIPHDFVFMLVGEWSERMPEYRARLKELNDADELINSIETYGALLSYRP